MIKIENIDIYGWEAAIRGMRNPFDSWEKSDTEYDKSMVRTVCDSDIACPYIGQNDLELMMRLSHAGTDHSKFLRMVTVTMDVCAPLYWWKQFDTYKVGTVANSCSTMHTLCNRSLTEDDFSIEHLSSEKRAFFGLYISEINEEIERYKETKDKSHWWNVEQMLPASFNQKRTILANYAVLGRIYHSRKNHKLDEWHEYCHMIEQLPYSKLITEGET